MRWQEDMAVAEIFLGVKVPKGHFWSKVLNCFDKYLGVALIVIQCFAACRHFVYAGFCKTLFDKPVGGSGCKRVYAVQIQFATFFLYMIQELSCSSILLIFFENSDAGQFSRG